jgi:hypothetical protein
MGLLNENDVEYLKSIKVKGELYLEFDCIVTEQMYQLLEHSMGQFVKTLCISDFTYQSRQDNTFINDEIIVERILAACPNLETFRFNARRPVVQDDLYDLPPSAYKNYKE